MGRSKSTREKVGLRVSVPKEQNDESEKQENGVSIWHAGNF